MASRVVSRIPRLLAHRRFAAFGTVRPDDAQYTSDGFNSLIDAAAGTSAKCAPFPVNQRSKLFNVGHSGVQRFWFSSLVSPQPEERESATISDEEQSSQIVAGKESLETNGSSKAAKKIEEKTDMKDELSIDDLVKLVVEKEELLKLKHQEIEKMQDKVLRSYAEMENVIARTKREAENSKKFAIQSFAKSLLDVSDNLGRASSVVKESFSKLDSSKDTAGAVPLLKTLLEGVEMTDKQLAEVFRKFGVEKFDSVNEHFDPHRHHAVFQVSDASKPPGTVAAVLKAGYMLYDRILRPAEVGVTQAPESEANLNSEG